MESSPPPFWRHHVCGSRFLLRVDASHIEQSRFNLLTPRKMLGHWYPVLSIIVGIFGMAVSAQEGKDKDPLTDFCRLFGHATAEVDRKLFIDGGLFNSNPISGNKYNRTSKPNLMLHYRETTADKPKIPTCCTAISMSPSRVCHRLLPILPRTRLFHQYLEASSGQTM